MRLIINGCAGRMGRVLLRLVHEAESCTLAGGLETETNPHQGKDLGQLFGSQALGIDVSIDALTLMTQADAIIDFSTPDASCDLADLAAQARIIHVIGTTGFSEDQEKRLAAAARHATLIKSGNMSLGVNLLAGLVAQAAKSLDMAWDIEILDMHHRHKVDAPSGTALLLGDAAAHARGQDLATVSESGRHGAQAKRQEGAIGFAALRGGSVVGDHEVIFATENEQIRLSHRAESRDIFARGALKAALWARDKGPGLFTMQDVLGL